MIQTVSGRRLGCGAGHALIPQFALEDSDVVVFFYSGPGSDEAGCNERGIIFFQSSDGREWFANQFTFRPDEVAWFSGRISERLLLTVKSSSRKRLAGTLAVGPRRDVAGTRGLPAGGAHATAAWQTLAVPA